jgi:four helix bundle protein
LKNYKELLVWQKRVNLALELYKSTSHFPDRQKFGLTNQIRRAATSISANIAEGWGRGTSREYVHFLLVAGGSLMELETHSMIARGLGYMSQDQLDETTAKSQEVAKLLNGLIQSLKGRSQIPNS